MKELTNPDQETALKVIGKLEFFNSFSDYEKRRIIAFHTHFQKFRMGEYIVREGRTDTSFFILISGTVSVVKAGKSMPLAELKTGDFFGEISFLTNRPRTTNVVANEPCITLRIDQELMANLGAEIREKIKDRLISQLVERLDQMNAMISKMSFASF